MTARYLSEFVNNKVNPRYRVVAFSGTPQGASFIPSDNTRSRGKATIERDAVLAFASGDGSKDARQAILLSHVKDDTYSTVTYVCDSEKIVKVREVKSQVIKAEALDILEEKFSHIDVGVEGESFQAEAEQMLSSTAAGPFPSHSSSPANSTSSAGSHDVEVCLHANDHFKRCMKAPSACIGHFLCLRCCLR